MPPAYAPGSRTVSVGLEGHGRLFPLNWSVAAGLRVRWFGGGWGDFDGYWPACVRWFGGEQRFDGHWPALARRNHAPSHTALHRRPAAVVRRWPTGLQRPPVADGFWAVA